MRLFTRIRLLRFRGKVLRWWRAHATPRRLTLLAEGLLCAGALLVVTTGPTAVALERFGTRADVVAALATVAAFVLVHATVGRRVVLELERRAAPPAYDEHRVLLDLGDEARRAHGIDELFASVAGHVGEALDTDRVAVFVRDDATGEFVCRAWTPRRDGAVGGGRPPALPANAFVVRRLAKMAIPLTLGDEDFRAWADAFASAPERVRESREREMAALRDTAAHLLVPARIKDQVVGVLALGRRRSGHAYSASDREVLLVVASQLAFLSEHAKLVDRIVAEDRLRRELALAAEVQQRLFPGEPPPAPGLDLAAICKPAREVGGDYYDFLDLGGGRIGLAVADVAGKGMSAALLMSNVQASLRSHALDGSRPVRDLVGGVNKLLCRSTGPSSYVTFFYAEVDSGRHRFTYVNAGHNPPLLMRAGADGPAFRELTSGGPVLGMFEQLRFEEETVDLECGDLLVAFTDGVTEALDAAGEEFGEGRLRETLAGASGLTALEARDAILARVEAWCAGTPQHDDLTFAVMKVL